MRLPVSRLHYITLKFGVVDKYHPTGHNGVDYSGRFDKTVYAPESGTIRYEWQPSAGGNVLVLTTKTGEHRLAHLSTMVKKFGSVKEGQILGVMGATGLATGVHLHWGLKIKGRYVNPLLYISPAKEENADEMITNKDHLRSLWYQYVGKSPSAADFAGYLGKRSYAYTVDKLDKVKTDLPKLLADRDSIKNKLRNADKIIAAQKAAIAKLVAEKSQTGKAAIVADLETKVPMVEEPSFWDKLKAYFGG